MIYNQEDILKEYFGEFSHDEFVHGEIISKKGDKYIGGFKNWKKHGKGSLKTSE